MIRAIRVETHGGNSVALDFSAQQQHFIMTFVRDSGEPQIILADRDLLENARLALDVFLKDMGE